MKKIDLTKSNLAISILKHFYIDDDRPFNVAFSGGKDSSVLVLLIFEMLHELRSNNNKIIKPIHIINSNTLAELPPILKHNQTTLTSIEEYAKKYNFPVYVHEVTPDNKNTLNYQLLGVGMPPPNHSFRWCTSKLKVNPIDKEILQVFPDGQFITIIGSRRDESYTRNQKITKQTLKGSHLKFNDRYKNASNLMPIEDWTTKDVWTYLLKHNNTIINVDFLWNLYSDASNKNSDECKFVGAGGKDIDDGKLGCGVSRFGCWQCYVVRDNDKSLNGLLESGYENIDLYKTYRDYYWSLTSQPWEKTRDVYSHRTQKKEFYQGNSEIIAPKGITLKLRIKLFEKFMELNQKVNYSLITHNEIILIQERWFLEGDINFKAFKICRRYGLTIRWLGLKESCLQKRNEAKKYYKEYLTSKCYKEKYSVITRKRLAVQTIIKPDKVSNLFFPTKNEEKKIRNIWKKLKS